MTAPPSYNKSKSYTRRARDCEALIEARPSLFFSGYEPVQGCPTFVRGARGAYLWDVDGNKYIDLLLGYGSVILGHGHPSVRRAVVDALDELGANPTLLSANQILLAEKITSLIPNADRVTFLKTGSDAVNAAVRLARAATGKRHVLQWGMHGWHDWCAVRSPGVLAEVKSYTHALQYGDIDQIRKLFKELQGDIACIVMMPYEIAQPPDGYFDEIRSICDLHGALLILDEVRSGFRVSLGGAQRKFGINADLIALSKAMANGHPISALAGRKKWMSQILKLGLTVTFYRGPIEIAAALATITQLEDMDGPGILAKVGEKIIREANKVIEAIDIPASVKGERTSLGIVFGYGDRYDNDRALRLFCHSMIRSGVLINPAHHWFLSTEIGEHDSDYIVGAIEEALKCVKGNI